MSGNKQREETRRKVESYGFLRETFDYDERGLMVWKTDRPNKIRIGKKVGGRGNTSRGNVVSIDDCAFLARRLVWLWHGNEIPDDFVVGVKNGGCYDDRIENLILKPRKPCVAKDRSAERDVELLRTLFFYDSCTGQISWKVSHSNNVKVGDTIRGETVGINKVFFWLFVV